MKRFLTGLAVIFASACGGDGGVIGPDDEGEVIPGVSANASVVEFLSNPEALPQKKAWYVSVRVTLTNTTDAAITLHYPAGCPVGVRFYSSENDALLYDGTLAPCNVTTTVPLTIQAGASGVLESGTRPPWEITGDSLPAAPYRATGVLRITGEAPLELEAGIANIQTCVLSPDFMCSPHVGSAPAELRRAS